MPRDHSAWDRTGLPYGKADPGRRLSAATAYQARSLARTERFDQALRSTAPDSTICADYVARIAAVRALVLRQVMGAPPITRAGRRSFASDVAMETGIVMVLTAVAAIIGTTALIGTTVVLALSIGAIAVFRVRSRDRLKLPLIALDAGECPDCGYNLSGAPPGLSLSCTGGVNVGPSACPECGVPWPLVPPACAP